MSIQREALEAARDALKAARKHHGVVLLSDPLQDAWKYYRVSEQIDGALSAISAALSAPTEQVPADRSALAEIAGIKAWAPEDASAHLRYVIDLAKAAIAASPSAPTAVQPDWTKRIGQALNDACWAFVEAMPYRLPGPIFNNLKLALKATIEAYLVIESSALTPTERAACQQCGSDPHKMSCSVGSKTQLRLTADEAPAAVQPAAGQDEQSEQSAFESWLERTRPSGDVEDVQRQWEASSDFADWLESARATPTAAKEAGGVDALAEIAGIKAWAPEDASAHLRYVIDLAKAARAAQPATPVAPIYPLPDSLYPGSKDWLAADYAGRVEYLHTMYESAKQTLDAYLSAPKTLEVLNAAEIGLANLVSYQSSGNTPSICEFGQARRALDAVRAAKNNMTLGGE